MPFTIRDASANTASIGPLTVLPHTDGSAYTLSEAPRRGAGL
ncbi:MAG: hypothetical protein WAL22_20180 [Solirubrobacteraceae bacterium]